MSQTEMTRTGSDHLVESFRYIWTIFAPFLGLLLITGLFAWLTRETGSFLTVDNWRLIAVQTVVVGVAALGMTAVMIAGGIDLSIGSAVALITVAIAVSVRDAGLPMPLAMGLGVLVGIVCGLINGALITGLRVVPFIITLGSMKVFRGVSKWLSSSSTVYVPRETKSPWMDAILAADPSPSWLVVAPGVWLLLVLALVLVIVLRSSVLGRYVYAIGSNESTARLCGINVPGVKLVVYGLAGLATGLAGVLQFLFLNAEGDPTTSDGLELRVIAAVVIGGGSLSGGEGTVLGTLIGCLIMSVLDNGCIHAGLSNATQDVIIGIIIVAAVAIDRLRRSRNA